MLWGAQLALNGAWSWLFFRKHDPKAALIDIALLDAAVCAYALVARRADPLEALTIAPYAAWIGFATLLNAEILRRNGPTSTAAGRLRNSSRICASRS